MEDCNYYWIGLIVVFVTVCVGLLYDKLEKSCMYGYFSHSQLGQSMFGTSNFGTE